MNIHDRAHAARAKTITGVIAAALVAADMPAVAFCVRVQWAGVAPDPDAVLLTLVPPTSGCPRYRLGIGRRPRSYFHERARTGFDMPAIVNEIATAHDVRIADEAHEKAAAKVRKEARRIMRLHGLREDDAVSIEERGGRLRFVMDAEVTAEQVAAVVSTCRAVRVLGERTGKAER